MGPRSKASEPFVRPACEFNNLSDAFKISAVRNFKPQFAQLYHHRLTIMRRKCQQTAAVKWGKDFREAKLNDLEEGQMVYLIGTLYKEMEMKPNILREIMEDTEVPMQPILPRYTQDDDTLILEDEAQRIVLVGNIEMHKCVTGVTAAVLGEEDSLGRFAVRDVCYIGMPPQPQPALAETDCYLAFVSGLGLAPNAPSAFSFDICIETLTGQLGAKEQLRKMTNVVGLVIAGNLIESDHLERKENAMKARYLARHTIAGSVDRMRTVDDMLMQLVSGVDVFVMPGNNDPGNYMLPQQPLHPSMFPHSFRSSGLHLVPNPFQADMNGVRILGTSGQNVTDVYKNSQIDDPLEIMQRTLEWSHIAPTAPDTLGCCPFIDEDPFILDAVPTIYFAGNQSVGSHRICNGPEGQRVLLLSVPEFVTAPSMMLVNLRTLKVESIRFEDRVKSSDPNKLSKLKVV